MNWTKGMAEHRQKPHRAICQDTVTFFIHDDVIKWKHFPRYWPFVREIHRYPVNSPHKVQWRGALMFSVICVWINGWVNNREAGDLRRYRAHYDVTVMCHCYSADVATKNNDYLPQSISVNVSKKQQLICWVILWSRSSLTFRCPSSLGRINCRKKAVMPKSDFKLSLLYCCIIQTMWDR